MSGMKFRRTCSVCNATFFSPDRKAAYCLKCLKKRVVKHVPPEPRAAAPLPRVVPRAIPKPSVAVAEPRRHKQPRVAKVSTLTPELRERILELYREPVAGRKIQAREAPHH